MVNHTDRLLQRDPCIIKDSFERTLGHVPINHDQLKDGAEMGQFNIVVAEKRLSVYLLVSASPFSVYHVVTKASRFYRRCSGMGSIKI